MKTIKQILGLCEHKWKIFYKNSVVDEYGDKLYTKYHLQCEKCGDIKIKKAK